MLDTDEISPRQSKTGHGSGHLRHEYLITYAYFVKCYLQWFASVSDPEKWTKNVAQRK